MLQQQYLPEQITQNLQRNGMDGIAATAEDAEVQTRFMAELALTHPKYAGLLDGSIYLMRRREIKFRNFNSIPPSRGIGLKRNV